MQTEPVAGAFGTIANAGVLGAVVVIFAAVIVYLWRHFVDERKTMEAAHRKEREEQEKTCKAEREAAAALHRAERDDLNRQIREITEKHRSDLNAVHDARIADAEMIHKQLFEVAKQCTAVMESTASALHVHKDVAGEHRDAQREAAEELRKLSSLLNSLSEEIRMRFRAPRP